MTMPMTLTTETISTALMALVCASGGMYGYAMKRSLPSLVAGLGFGAMFGYST